MEIWEHPDTRTDFLVMMASREEVEAGETSQTLASLNRLLDPEMAKRLKGRLLFGIAGYDEDPRDLWEVEEVRTWMTEVDKAFPYWFYFLHTGSRSTLPLVVFSLCRYEVVPGGKLVSSPDLARFMETHFLAMNRLAGVSEIAPEEIDERTAEIDEFFNGRGS